jgi:ribonucleoside-diphosphate reductase alpha chain
MAKEGSTLSGMMDSFATAVSVALQYGVPLRLFCAKFAHSRFEPAGYTGNPEIPIAKSIVDYIFRWLAARFLSAEDRDALGIISRREAAVSGVGAPTVTAATAAAPTSAATGTAPNQVNPKQLAAELTFRNQEDAPSCSDCGALMVRNGACYKCMNCGSTSGCS